MCDVLSGDPSRVERPHGELRAGLADRLRGDDADGLADVDHATGCEIAPVARATDTDLRLAGDHGPDLNGLDT